jgi:energy-coupling factor transporter ATP-binding protein EcfA2
MSGRALLIQWANDQDDWVREIVASVLESNTELRVDKIQAAYEHLLVEKGLASGDRPATPALVERAAPGRIEEPLALVSIANVKNVNALASEQSIAFNPRLTVLFGRNGCGKTGYARIMKRLSSVRSEQRILPNISLGSGGGQAEAQVAYRLGAVEQTCAWKGEAGVAPLTRIDVFDAQDAPTYVDGDLTYVYTPAEVALFRHVTTAIDAVRERLDQAKRDKSPGGNVFVQHFSRDVTFYAKIDTFGAITDLAELRSLATVTPAEEASLDGLRETIDALGSHSFHAQLQATQADLDLCAQANTVAGRLLAFDMAVHDAAVVALAEAEKQQTEATRTAFAEQAPPGFLTAEWRAFVEAGEQYIQRLGTGVYPTKDSSCVYCQQPLTQAALSLLKKYRDLCNDRLERQVVDARTKLEAIRRPIAKLDLRPLQQLVHQHLEIVVPGALVPAFVRDSQLVVEVGGAMQAAIGKNSALGTAPMGDEFKAAMSRLAEAHVDAEKRLAGLKGKTEDRAKLLADSRAKKIMLEARLKLRELLPSIEPYVERAKWAALAETLLRRFKGLTKTLTEASKLASETLINQDFERAFREECRALNAPHVNLDFLGQKGRAARRKLLHPEYRLSETLSEGEQKVVALADFLAEARIRTTNAPVIFDDPVTSLDYERIQEVASRLAALARERQVIVFTHNIWFAVELLDRFRDGRKDCAYYDIRVVDERRGVVTGGTHPRSDTPSDLKARINRLLTEAKKATGDVQEALVQRGYGILRALCEVGVESEMLGGLIRRFEPNVRLTVLPDIKPVAFKEAGERIFGVYERTCRYIEAHSQPMEQLNVVSRTAKELEDDLKVVVEAIDGYKKAAA